MLYEAKNLSIYFFSFDGLEDYGGGEFISKKMYYDRSATHQLA